MKQKKIKRMLSLLLALALLCAVAPRLTLSASAEYSGSCGGNVEWSFNSETGEMLITGTGRMSEEFDGAHLPWEDIQQQIKTVTICDGVTSIGAWAFAYCSKLTAVSIPDGVVEIGARAFTGGGLLSVYIPASVNIIGGNAFAGCHKMSAITVDPANQSYCSDAKGVLFNKDKTILIKCPESMKGSYTVPDGVTDIGNAFYDCSGLTSIVIPNSVEAIGYLNLGYYYVPFDGYHTVSGFTIFGYTGSAAEQYANENMFTFCPLGTFSDVKAGAWYALPVSWAVANGITAGTGDGQFSPNQPCTREQIITYLWIASGRPEPQATESPFSDVPEGKYFFKPVLWAVEEKITGGSGDGKFGVGEPCTRAQAMTFLWISLGRPAPASTDIPFEDVKPNNYFCKPVLWAVENYITGGTSATTFGPNDTCTRGQIVTFLYKAIE